MSYQVLARKYRPRFFREMVGQEHVLQALINALDTDRLHHAYLFTGTRGVGKTSLARILAKCLNCEEKVSSEPCGVCNACVEINEGRFVDLIEVDAASRTRVEDTRELLDNVQYLPTKGRYKIYLIDEVHMLSTHSFNALLKTLEEPPEHVKFLLATTDPQKLPATILSRCLQFNLKNMSPRFIVSHLEHLLKKENMAFEMQALWSLANAAKGSMRDALSLTDQAIAFCSGNVAYIPVSQMLGTIDQQSVFRLAEALAAHKASELLQIVTELSEYSPDYSAILDDLLLCLHRLTIAQIVPDALDDSQGDRERLLQLAQCITAEELQLFYQMGLLGKKDLSLAPDAKTGLEMTLLRMLTFRPQGVKEPLSNASGNPPMPQNEPKSQPKPESNNDLVQNPVNHSAEMQPSASPVKSQAGYKGSLADIAPSDKAKTKKGVDNNAVNVALMADVKSEPTGAMPALASNIEPEYREENTQAVRSKPAPENSKSQENNTETVQDTAGVSLAASIDIPEADADSLRPTAAIDESNHTIDPTRQFPLDNAAWLEVFTDIPFEGLIKSIAAQSVLYEVNGSQWFMLLDQQQAQLFNANHPQQIADVLGGYFQQKVDVDIRLTGHDLITPDVFLQNIKTNNQQKALHEIKADAGYQSIIKDYAAKLDESSVVFTNTGDKP